MKQQIFEKYNGVEITDPMLQEAAQLFSGHYGVWDKQAWRKIGRFAEAGCHIRFSKEKLRRDHVVEGMTSYVKVTVDGILAGHVLACRWRREGKIVCWITQLVVHCHYRERGLATGLLNLLREPEDQIYGVMSSHPAACLAAAKAFGGSINKIQMEFIKDHADSILKASPVRYVREAKLRGNLFDPGDDTSLVSCVDTDFWVNHQEPLKALARAREAGNWPLGDLLESHEFLLIGYVRK